MLVNYFSTSKVFSSTKYKFELVYRDNCYTIAVMSYNIHRFLTLFVFERVNGL